MREQLSAELDAAIHRAGVQHRHRLAAALKPAVAESIAPVVGLQAGDQLLLHALLLQAQGHHRISTLEGTIEITSDPTAVSTEIELTYLYRGATKTWKVTAPEGKLFYPLMLCYAKTVVVEGTRVIATLEFLLPFRDSPPGSTAP